MQDAEPAIAERWFNNAEQFPRFLSELRAVGLSDAQYRALSEEMELAKADIDALLERAEQSWQAIKADTTRC